MTIDEILINELDNSNDWDFLVMNYSLSEEILIKFKDKINWEYACQFQNLSENFIDTFSDILPWEYISYYQKLSEEFIFKHINDIKVGWLIYNVNLTGSLKDKIFKYMREQNEIKSQTGIK